MELEHDKLKALPWGVALGASYDRDLRIVVIRSIYSPGVMVDSGKLQQWVKWVRISAIVDACFRLIVDGVSAPSWTRRGCAQARG